MRSAGVTPDDRADDASEKKRSGDDRQHVSENHIGSERQSPGGVNGLRICVRVSRPASHRQSDGKQQQAKDSDDRLRCCHSAQNARDHLSPHAANGQERRLLTDGAIGPMDWNAGSADTARSTDSQACIPTHTGRAATPASSPLADA
jgi:hypothetical protein